MFHKKYIFILSIPRNIELPKNYSFRKTFEFCEVMTIFLENEISMEGIHRSTNAVWKGEDNFGNNIKSKFKIVCEMKEDIFKDNYESENKDLLLKDFMENEGERHKFFLGLFVDTINSLIRIHQYINDKFHVWEIGKKEIPKFEIYLKEGEQPIFVNSFGKGSFQINNKIYQNELIENAKRINYFINSRQDFNEAYRIFNYSYEFYKLGLYRVALTEIQSAIEYYLVILVNDLEKNNKDFLKKFSGDKIVPKLKKFSNLKNINFSYENWVKKNKDFENCYKLRNDILHGKKITKLDSKMCFKYLKIYEDLFYSIDESVK